MGSKNKILDGQSEGAEGMPPPGEAARSDRDHDSADALMQRAGELLALANSSEMPRESDAQQGFVNSLADSLASLRSLLQQKDQELKHLKQRSDTVARAQANAILHSVEIIEELELTKQSLSEARAEAEEAAKDTSRLAETIFQRTSDAVLVIDSNLQCIECNANVTQLFSCDHEDIIGTWPAAFDQARDTDQYEMRHTLRTACAEIDNCRHCNIRGPIASAFASRVLGGSLPQLAGDA